MLGTAIAVAAVEVLLATWINIVHRRKPLTGGALLVFRGAMVLTTLSLLCIVGAVMLEVPDSRGLFVVLALVAIGVLLARTFNGKTPPRQPLHAETQQAPQQPPQQGGQQAQRQPDISRYTVRSAPVVSGGGVRSARVRRIQAMEDGYGN